MIKYPAATLGGIDRVPTQPMTIGAVLNHRAQAPKYWTGTVPSHDDFGMPIESIFIDGATRQGPWAFMTPTTHMSRGRGLGKGRGQMYEKQADGRWLKIAG